MYEAFEPELDWWRFSVRVKQRDIPKLGAMLDDLVANKPEKVAEMQVCSTEEQVWSTEVQKHRVCTVQHFHRSTDLSTAMGETRMVAHCI